MEKILRQKLNEMNTLMLSGKWYYQGSTKKFSDICLRNILPRDNSIPSMLLFGKDNFGTDGKKCFYYDEKYLNFSKYLVNLRELPEKTTMLEDDSEDKIYKYFVFDVMTPTLVVFDNGAEDEELTYHVFNNFCKIIEVYSKEEVIKSYIDNSIVYNYQDLPEESYFGKYKCIDSITDDQIENYSGDKRYNEEEPPYYLLDNLFEELVIGKNGVNVFKGKKPTIVKNSSQTVEINSKNAIYPIFFNKNDFIIEDLHRNLQLKGVVREINKTKYLFVRVEQNIDPIERYYVYKKV